ncbi:potassium voltage-gated channel subfamily A member 2-like [Rhopilema esculentum]|uniref:potassium voltage-gated channel subfamily A member 2-like n=1 Tax=Rhopilema esculentum TaxID=499914 RepID=UPI0031E31E8B
MSDVMKEEEETIELLSPSSGTVHKKPEDLNQKLANGKEDQIITINVSGRIFQTLESTLSRFPSSLLGSKESRKQLRTDENGHVFLNRNQRAFEILLTFYQTGIFEEPTGVNLNVFKHEIRYFGLVDEAIECGVKDLIVRPAIFPKRKWQAALWNVLEEPQSSIAARVVAVVSLVVIVISVIVFCMETEPEIRQQTPKYKVTNAVIQYLEIICVVYFSGEFILRLIASPNKIRFFVDFLNIIDLLAIVPFYITLATKSEGRVSIYFLRTIRLVRVFRIFKLSRYSGEMKILGKALIDSARELCVLLFFIVLGVILFSSAAFYAEDGTSDTMFKSIPGAFWWSIVTMTTVGYGDEVPKTTVGRLVGAVCAMCGILVIAMPIPIIVNNFTRQYLRLEPVSKYWVQIKAEEQLQGRKKLFSGIPLPQIYLEQKNRNLEEVKTGTNPS